MDADKKQASADSPRQVGLLRGCPPVTEGLQSEKGLSRECHEGMNALVTGSNGFLGSHLVEGLLAKGYDVHCLVRRTSDLRWLTGLPVRFVYGDVTLPESLREAVAGKDYVYHAAGILKGRSQWAFDRVNLHGTANLLKACWEYSRSLGRFVLISSQSAGGPSRNKIPATETSEPRPVSRYGRSKLKAEQEARRYLRRLPITIVRPPAIFGPRDSGMYPFFKLLKQGVVALVSGKRCANLVYVRDVVSGAILAGEKEAAVGQTYYVAAERGCAWREFAEAAARAMGVRPLVVSVPAAAVKAIGGWNTLTGALTGRARMLDWQKANEILQPYWLCDISKAKRELGYRPKYSLEDGLRETSNWYVKEGWI